MSRDVKDTDPSGRYVRFETELGRGAYKTVYRAIDRDMGIEVAWNQIPLDQNADLEQLWKEINILGSLSHPNILEYHASWINEKHLYLVFITEFMSSGTLSEFVKKANGVKLRVLKSWCTQILEGIHYLHTREPPIIHRDIKCDNIFINSNGMVKIGDLGLATKNIPLSANKRSIIGTPEFMAPEFYEENYDEKVDIWAFGLCVLEMSTLDYPYYECSNPAQVFKRVSSGQKPRNLYRIQNPQVFAFIRECLLPASERKSAGELLSDPFLTQNIDEDSNRLVELRTDAEVDILFKECGVPLFPAFLTPQQEATIENMILEKNIHNAINSINLKDPAINHSSSSLLLPGFIISKVDSDMNNNFSNKKNTFPLLGTNNSHIMLNHSSDSVEQNIDIDSSSMVKVAIPQDNDENNNNNNNNNINALFTQQEVNDNILQNNLQSNNSKKVNILQNIQQKNNLQNTDTQYNILLQNNPQSLGNSQDNSTNFQLSTLHNVSPIQINSLNQSNLIQIQTNNNNNNNQYNNIINSPPQNINSNQNIQSSQIILNVNQQQKQQRITPPLQYETISPPKKSYNIQKQHEVPQKSVQQQNSQQPNIQNSQSVQKNIQHDLIVQNQRQYDCQNQSIPIQNYQQKSVINNIHANTSNIVISNPVSNGKAGNQVQIVPHHSNSFDCHPQHSGITSKNPVFPQKVLINSQQQQITLQEKIGILQNQYPKPQNFVNQNTVQTQQLNNSGQNTIQGQINQKKQQNNLNQNAVQIQQQLNNSGQNIMQNQLSQQKKNINHNSIQNQAISCKQSEIGHSQIQQYEIPHSQQQQIDAQKRKRSSDIGNYGDQSSDIMINNIGNPTPQNLNFSSKLGSIYIEDSENSTQLEILIDVYPFSKTLDPNSIVLKLTLSSGSNDSIVFECDYHMLNDTPLLVATEMVQEWKLPKSSIDQISSYLDSKILEYITFLNKFNNQHGGVPMRSKNSTNHTKVQSPAAGLRNPIQNFLGPQFPGFSDSISSENFSYDLEDSLVFDPFSDTRNTEVTSLMTSANSPKRFFIASSNKNLPLDGNNSNFSQHLNASNHDKVAIVSKSSDQEEINDIFVATTPKNNFKNIGNANNNPGISHINLNRVVNMNNSNEIVQNTLTVVNQSNFLIPISEKNSIKTTQIDQKQQINSTAMQQSMHNNNATVYVDKLGAEKHVNTR